MSPETISFLDAESRFDRLKSPIADIGTSSRQARFVCYLCASFVSITNLTVIRSYQADYFFTACSTRLLRLS
ncbi:hypothetical protein QUB63_02780 [Microcoleus sp. ARI1-B5]|uniref:hypothetical protein n=1 Tax=unclassified Microcoleus TaxID=2642155 RepID=UPI002FD01CE6